MGEQEADLSCFLAKVKFINRTTNTVHICTTKTDKHLQEHPVIFFLAN